jgi:hypothetical protein
MRNIFFLIFEYNINYMHLFSSNFNLINTNSNYDQIKKIKF